MPAVPVGHLGSGPPSGSLELSRGVNRVFPGVSCGPAIYLEAISLRGSTRAGAEFAPLSQLGGAFVAAAAAGDGLEPWRPSPA